MRAAVLFEPGTPLRMEEVQLAPPGSGEVRVRVVAAGVCHSDYHVMKGDIPQPLPVVLGHEGAGVVEEVGAGVTGVAPGDHVVLLWRAACGRCEYCGRGRPALCPAGNRIRNTGLLGDGTSRLRLGSDGQQIYHFLGVSCFAEQAVCPAESVLRVPRDLPLDIVALCGCSVITGVGAAVNTAGVEPGSTVVVIGAGGVGLSTIMGAQLCGAAHIIAADRIPARLELARSFGATDVVDTSREDLVRAVRQRGGADYAFEVIGVPDLLAQAVRMLRPGGTAVAVGLAPAGKTVAIDPLALVRDEKTLKGSIYGSTRPYADFPRIFELYRQGRLPLDRLLSHRFPMDQINEAYDALIRGELSRAVLTP
jgi:Zn-dependent alcohol dehydrogenase